MPTPRRIRLALFCAALWGVLALPAPGQPTRSAAHVNVDGTWIKVFAPAASQKAPTPPDDRPPPTRSPGLGVIWHTSDRIAVPRRIELADATNETWVALDTNSQRLVYLQTTGDGSPLYEYDLSQEDPALVTVASAEDASLAAVGLRAAGSVFVRGFDSTSSQTPLWNYTFDPPYELMTYNGVSVAADGSLVAAVAYNLAGPQALVVILDGLTGAELRRLESSTAITTVELSADGARAILTAGATINVIETDGMSTLHSFEAASPGAVARLSPDGTVAVAGALDLSVYRDTGTDWMQIWHEADPNQWYGGGLAISGDSGTLFAASSDFPGRLGHTYRIIDLVGGGELVRTTRTGTGSYEDVIWRAEASADGQVFALVTWGTENNDHPELMVFDREARLIGSIDTPGSPFGLDLSRDGRYVGVGAKAVHGTTFGQGGDVYVYQVAPCHGDLTGDGFIDLSDLAALLPNYRAVVSVNYEDGDLDGDVDVDLSDLSALLALYGTSCP